MTDDIVTRLREGEKWHRNGYIEVQSGFYDFLADEIERERKEAADEIERLRRCLQHAINHVGKWGLFTAEEKQAILAEYEQAVRGE